MADDRQQQLQGLTDFLRTIQKPGKAIESVGPDESLSLIHISEPTRPY